MTELFPAILDAPAWNSQTDEVLRCQAVIQETHDVKTFVFTAPEPRRFLFRPGQFMTLVLPVGGEEVNRCYTVSSSPSRPYALSITVKRVPGGWFRTGCTILCVKTWMCACSAPWVISPVTVLRRAVSCFCRQAAALLP